MLSRLKNVALKSSGPVQHLFYCLICFIISYIKITGNGRILCQISAWCPMTAFTLL